MKATKNRTRNTLLAAAVIAFMLRKKRPNVYLWNTAQGGFYNYYLLPDGSGACTCSAALANENPKLPDLRFEATIEFSDDKDANVMQSREGITFILWKHTDDPLVYCQIRRDTDFWGLAINPESGEVYTMDIDSDGQIVVTSHGYSFG